jgi:hypothetical protein
MPVRISQDLATILLVETLRVGAAVLMIAGGALVIGALLETMTNTTELEVWSPCTKTTP